MDSNAWLDAKYVSLISFRLRNFKQKKNNLWNFSCPLCGDSKTHPRKARGYVYPYKGRLLYKCQKCGESLDVPTLVRRLDQQLFDDYTKEKLAASYLENKSQHKEHDDFVKKLQPPKFYSETPLASLRKISQLKPEHPVKQYVMSRLIPSEYHHKLYLTMKFKAWVNSFQPDKFESLDHDEPRLIIPFLDKDQNLIGFQGRSFSKKSNMRYITIMLDEDQIKLYGLENLDEKKHIYVVEGPIDSMFLPNALASAGSDVTTNLLSLGIDQSQFTIVYDNEPRNPTTIKKIERAIENGFAVCIWPENVHEKDINDMIKRGRTQQEVVDIINNFTYNGLNAKFHLGQWSKV